MANTSPEILDAERRWRAGVASRSLIMTLSIGDGVSLERERDAGPLPLAETGPMSM